MIPTSRIAEKVMKESGRGNGRQFRNKTNGQERFEKRVIEVRSFIRESVHEGSIKELGAKMKNDSRYFTEASHLLRNDADSKVRAGCASAFALAAEKRAVFHGFGEILQEVSKDPEHKVRAEVMRLSGAIISNGICFAPGVYWMGVPDAILQAGFSDSEYIVKDAASRVALRLAKEGGPVSPDIISELNKSDHPCAEKALFYVAQNELRVLLDSNAFEMGELQKLFSNGNSVLYQKALRQMGHHGESALVKENAKTFLSTLPALPSKKSEEW